MLFIGLFDEQELERSGAGLALCKQAAQLPIAGGGQLGVEQNDLRTFGRHGSQGRGSLGRLQHLIAHQVEESG